MSYKEKISEYIRATEGMDAEHIIKFAHRAFGARLTFATSLGEEDQVITDMIAKVAPDIEIFTLDTGRLFPETYDLLAKTQKRYPMTLKIYCPDNEALEDMVRNHGINLFYESVENRKLCCGVRKVEPLKRALRDFDAWICGLRRDQAITRGTVETFEWDEFNQKVKVNPLARWTLSQLRAYIAEHRVDVNPLHAQGVLSIGCSCCTRAVNPGEDIRAGRWWWEAPEHKECGLHNRSKKGNS